jgi:hypothetical protein
MYKKVRNSNSIQRLSDGASIPDDPANTDYAKYLADVEADPTCVADADPIPVSEFTAKVNAKRDQMIDSGIQFEGHTFQTRAADRENILGAAQLAFMSGAQPGDLRWSNPDQDFTWITADNEVVKMDAQNMIKLAKAVAARKSLCIYHARALKDDIEAASDPSSINIEIGWPA